MQTKLYKPISVLLALLMMAGVIAVVPITASAADPVCSIGPYQYTDLADALAAVPADGTATIRLLDNITYADPIEIDGKTIIFNINGNGDDDTRYVGLFGKYTSYEAKPLNWFLFFVLFGWLWMWFI